jgi:putative component of membrane protein insertase Oxa1/YidC/SpoIIIJ protein YidD
MYCKFVCLFVLFVTVNSLKAQNSNDTFLINKQLNYQQQVLNPKNKTILHSSKKPGKEISFLMLYFYQKIVSEQISAGCGFNLSCSGYSIRAIKERGFVLGIFLTADRLTRCNGAAQLETENYLINHTNGKVIDEPQMHRFTN